MFENATTLQLIRALARHISLRRRTQFAMLLVLMLLASVAEMLTLGMALPFLSVLTGPERVFNHPAAQQLIRSFNITEPAQLLLPLSVCFGVAVAMAGLIRVVLLWANTRLSYAAGSDLGTNLYWNTLSQTYAVHCSQNSSEIIDGILNKTRSAINMITMLLELSTAAVILVFVLIALLLLDPYVAMVTLGGFGLLYGSVIRMTRRQLLINSKKIARESPRVIKSLQEGLGGVRDVLLDGTQSVYCQLYLEADRPLRRAQGNNTFITVSPRYVMEALGMLLLIVLSYWLMQDSDGFVKVVPTLGVFALCAQRVLPLLQQAYASWTGFQAGRRPLQEMLALLDQPVPMKWAKDLVTPIVFERSIQLRQLSFRYQAASVDAIKDINLTIEKGSRIGFIGKTGIGKSTLLDIIMGLLQPTSGCLFVDGQAIVPENTRAWQTHIAHVPQAIFLADSTIEENIAFGVPKNEIDRLRVRRAAEQAQMADSIEQWPAAYDTLVGERGVRLSGGQRQRIGIARALYKQADVIILDEATSALDTETELAVMQAIEKLSHSLTILIIAHRHDTLKGCTQIIEIGPAGIERIGTYLELLARRGLSQKESSRETRLIYTKSE